jgi:pimeloyl-ACP methyl ester carboxylesterase
MRFVAGAAAVALLAGGLGATIPAEAAASAPHHAAASVAWGACPSSFSDLRSVHAQCAQITVPIDYSNPGLGTTYIEISRIKHTSKHYQGVILSTPGGPGGAGLDLNYYLRETLKAEGSAADKAALQDYDWIGFDPRGIETSNPISCDPNYFSGDRESYVPRTKSILNYWLTRSQAYAQDCATAGGAAQLKLLDNDTTIDSARDMNSIREALGVPQISYYGFSYGTYLGQVYATLFPTHVRRLILDSNVDPRNVWYKANLTQDVAFQRNIEIWFSWLAKYNKTYHLGATRAAVQRRYNAEAARLAKHPIVSGGQKTVGPDEWNDIFLEAGYYESTWLFLAQAFADWAHTHNAKAGAAIAGLYQEIDTPGNDNEYAGYLAVECTDVQWPLSWKKWDTDNTRLNKRYPFETWNNAWFNAGCLYWKAPASTPVKINGSRIKSTLLIDETLDAATPFEGSEYVRTLFPHSVLLAEPGGTTHADSLSGDLCVDNTIADYLAYGKLPKRKAHAKWDITCKPLPRPVPPKHLSASASVPSPAALARVAQLAGLVG